MYEIKPNKTIEDKLEILSDAAKYDVACTSSGVSRAGKEGYLGNSVASGVCHAFSSDGRCISLLKILMSNCCIYDCKYCKNRISNDIPRATFTPDEICTLTIEFYKRNYIEGLFLSSGVIKNPDYTMEKICETLRLLRTTYKFNGYIHVKTIPGASDELIYSAGLLADRISINMEMPTQSSLIKVAPQKSMENILLPMNRISDTIAMHRIAIGKSPKMERAGINKFLVDSIWDSDTKRIEGSDKNAVINMLSTPNSNYNLPADRRDTLLKRPFAPGGQSTQMIIGASSETDYQLVKTTQALYQKFDLKRVFYSAYIPINEDDALPSLNTPVPILREHRLYQADWLLRFYGFDSEELFTPTEHFLDYRIDPKCNWALRHLDIFPVEVNTASADALLRVPGIGPLSVKKILAARRYGHITFEMLKKMRVVLKRAQYFITCSGKMLAGTLIDKQFISNRLVDSERKDVQLIEAPSDAFKQMNLFTDFGVNSVVS